MVAFCIFSKTHFDRVPTSFFTVSSTSFDHPPNASIIIYYIAVPHNQGAVVLILKVVDHTLLTFLQPSLHDYQSKGSSFLLPRLALPSGPQSVHQLD